MRTGKERRDGASATVGHKGSVISGTEVSLAPAVADEVRQRGLARTRGQCAPSTSDQSPSLESINPKEPLMITKPEWNGWTLDPELRTLSIEEKPADYEV